MQAIAAHEECADIDQAAVQRMQQLQSQAEAWQCVAQVCIAFQTEGRPDVVFLKIIAGMLTAVP